MKTHLACHATTLAPKFCQRLHTNVGIILRKILYSRSVLAVKVSSTETLKYGCNFKICLENRYVSGKCTVFKEQCPRHNNYAHRFCYSPNRPNKLALWAFALA